MLTKKIIDLIEANALQLSREIKRELLLHQSTRSYQNIDEKILYDWIYDVCSRFSYWLDEDREKGEVQEHYKNLGKERFRGGFELPEVISALYLTKRRLWEFIAASREADSALNLNQIVEASFLLVRFFDHAVLHVTEGYEEMLREYSYEAPLNNPERLAEAIAAKEKRQKEFLEEPKLPTFSYTKGMIRLGYYRQG
ncbi:MAG: hypothetical protein JSV14_17390 [Deltaproteobacteria bacterium]|nr:MAG: hypothetical protein JSV14_17390 [Deltaproteobacteria bacterium]